MTTIKDRPELAELENAGPMDPALKALWIQELRSGEYQQGEGRLRYLDAGGIERFCCLGVLCNIVQPSKWDKPEDHSGVGGYITLIAHNNAGDMPSSVVYERSGLPEAAGVELSRMNDDGMSFETIADWIEVNL